MHAEHLGDLAAVICVVSDHAHQDGLARVHLYSTIDISRELLLEHVRRPAVQAVFDDRPGRLEREDELACHSWVGKVVLPALAVRIVERRALSTRLDRKSTRLNSSH